MIVAGIDPGKSGAMVVLYDGVAATAHRVPLVKRKGKTEPAWFTWFMEWSFALDEAHPDLVVIEEIAARPGQGVTSMFNFGQTLGFAKAIAAATGARVEYITPSVWKRKLGLLKSDKRASIEMARRLIPSLQDELTRQKDDGVAEAALLAWYGQKYL